MSTLRGLTTTTLADQAYAALRQAIVGREFNPGQTITERELAARFQVSPTPVREALRRLEQEQLIQRSGPRTVRVTNFDEVKLLEIGLIESSLRAVAARLAAVHVTDDQLTSIEETLNRADEAREVAVDARSNDLPAAASEAQAVLAHLREFHRLIDEACGNEVLQRLLRTVEAFTYDERRRLIEWQVQHYRHQGTSERYGQHRQLLDAIRRHDPDEAERIMLLHARSGSAERITMSHARAASIESVGPREADDE